MGLLGCGWAGAQHLRALTALAPRADLQVVIDIDPERARTTAGERGAPAWATDYRPWLDRTQLDLLCICLPHHLHAEATIAAAEAGLHVLIEKPLAVTLAEADAMIAAAERAGVTLMVSENVRFQAAYARLAELLATGAIGRPFLVRIAREHQMHAYLRQRPWFIEQPSGGILYSGGIHDLELLRMLAGEIAHVYAIAAPRALPEMRADDTSLVAVGLASGAAALLVESFSLRTAQPGVHITAHGDGGSLWCYGDRIQLYTAAEDGHNALLEEVTCPETDTFVAAWAHLLDCLDSGAEPLTSGRSQRAPLAAVLAAYASIERGERVELAAFESSP